VAQRWFEIAFNHVWGTSPAYFRHICISIAILYDRASLHSCGTWWPGHAENSSGTLQTKLSLHSRSHLEHSSGSSALAVHLQKTVLVWCESPPSSKPITAENLERIKLNWTDVCESHIEIPWVMRLRRILAYYPRSNCWVAVDKGR